MLGCHRETQRNTLDQDSILVDLIEQLDKDYQKPNESYMSRGEKKKMMKKKAEEQEKIKLWEEPDFSKWYKENYKKKTIINDFSGFNDDSNDF